jgi:ArsR family transcriptional regulator
MKETACVDGLPIEFLERVSEVLKLLSHPHRLKIVEILDERGEAPVHDIVESLGLPQAATSQHLNQMKHVGILSSRRQGKEVWYSIADKRSIKILNCIKTKQAGK